MKNDKAGTVKNDDAGASIGRTIWKYKLEITDDQFITLPRVHDLLCIQLQHGEPALWAVVNPHSAPSKILIKCYGTGNGHPHPDERYLGTVQTGQLVWHFFQGVL